MANNEIKFKNVLSLIPDSISHTEVLSILYEEKGVTWEYVLALQSLTGFTVKESASCLNIGIFKLNAFKKPGSVISIAMKEHILLLLMLLKKGRALFGSYPSFTEWLSKENFYFDKKTPFSFLTTISGISFTYDRLTAMEFGDNV